MEIRQEITLAPDDCQIVSSRIINGSRDLIFKAWTDPLHLEKWWGPAGFTNTFHEYNLEPGGNWSFTMHGPDGKNYRNECVFIEIKAPVKLVWDHVTGPIFQLVANFDELPDNKTRVTFRQIFRSPKECENIKVYAVNANEENFDRLEQELKAMTP